jgi:hypothetical protein
MASQSKLTLQLLRNLRSIMSSSAATVAPPSQRLSGGRLARPAVLLAALLALPAMLWAQSPCAPQEPRDTGEGLVSGDHSVHSSVELGYRANELTGTSAMYDTLVDLHTGPRFLEESLDMESLNHQGLLFDSLNLTSCGWGGDPDNVLQLRADKNKWYDLHGSFRRDKYFSDYDLLSNPLNPTTSSPSVPVQDSPTEFDTTRRMTGVDLTLLPQSRLSFRLGFSHIDMGGPTYDAIHEGTEGLLLEPWNTSMNSYRMGADWRFAPRTVLSYDETLDYYRGDTDAQLAPFAAALLSNGTPVQLGVSWDTANSSPCALAAKTTTLISNDVLTNSACSGYFSYTRDQRVRTNTPIERVSFRSNFFQRVDLVGSFAYSDAEMTTPFDENFNGLLARTFTRAFTGTGTADASRISDNATAAATVHLTKHLRLIDKFDFNAFRIPQDGNFSETDSDCTVHGTCTLLTALGATTPTITPTLTLSSFNQSLKRNETDLAWDITKKIGARIGFRYSDRVFDDFATFTTGGETRITVDEYTSLAGIWARPTHNLRFNFDVENSSFDNVIVPIAPRKESRYRFQAGYNPRSWAVFGGSVNILEDSNGESGTNYVGHSRNYGLSSSLAPRAHLGLDLAYNYNDVIQNAYVCFADTPLTGEILPFVTGATTCPGPAPKPAAALMNYSYYTNHTQFGMALVRFRFDKRTTILAGGDITNVDGNIPQFNALQPLGSLEYRYYQPVANLRVDLGHDLAWNTGWNYYQYNEGSFIGPTASRYFHANNVTESVRYEF